MLSDIRTFWHDDAATYDDSAGHHPRTALELAAWRAALETLLPSPPSRVLDAGAGTGFLALKAAELGHHVTALDLAPAMLETLRTKAAASGLSIETVEGPAHQPPPGPFDAVIERHLVWTLPDPHGALVAWRAVAPAGRLVLFESLWGAAGGVAERWRGSLREVARRLRGIAPDHHGSYAPELRAQLPLAAGTAPGRLAAEVERAGWGAARVYRLRDVDWAARLALPVPERMLGVTPRLAVVAGAEPPRIKGWRRAASAR